MRGSSKLSAELFSYVDVEKRVRPDHPLRAIRELTNTTLAALSEVPAACRSASAFYHSAKWSLSAPSE